MSQQQLFATISGGDLYSFTLEECSRTFIGSTGIGFGDIAFTPNGRLWGIAGGELFEIDPVTASTTLVGPTGTNAVSLVGLNDSILLAENDLKLYAINTITANSSYIDTIGYQASGDLTWYDEDLYMTTAPYIIKMTLNNAYTDILSVVPIGSDVPTCEGAFTASFDGDYNSIIGFNGGDLIKICQIDGSHSMLCPNLNFGGTPGAASIRLATQIPQPVNCSTANIDGLVSDDSFLLFPNPVKHDLNIQLQENNNFDFVIYNTVGQVIKAGQLEKNRSTINVSDLTNGIYILEFSSSVSRRQQYFVVER
jgi:hypothetical protein